MKKFTVLLLCLIFLTIPIGSNFTHASFDLSDSFIYEITDTNLYVDIGENHYQKDGFLFTGDLYPEHTKVYTTIDRIIGIDIMFNFSIDDSWQYGFISSNWFDVLGLEFSYYTLYYTYLMVESWGNGFWLDSTLYQITPYIEPVYGDYINDLDSLGSEICEFFDKWWYPDIECDYVFTESNGIYYFESWVGGKIDALFGNYITDGTDFPTDIKFGNSMHLAVNKTSGLVHGYGRRGWIKGEINNQQVKSSLACEYVLEDYDFSKYQLGSMRYFGEDQYFLAVFLPVSILVLSIPIIVYFVNKRKIDKSLT
ncbi:MAG: choice-of-anchor S family protein [Candidatus Heimdallarchaeota archaeon]